jgi:hypothetical protein
MDRHMLESRYLSDRDKDYSRGYRDDRNGAAAARDLRINPYDSIRSNDIGLRRSVNSGQIASSSISDYRAYPSADKRAELSRSDLARDRYVAPVLRQHTCDLDLSKSCFNSRFSFGPALTELTLHADWSET